MMKKDRDAYTPVMQQFLRAKDEYPDAFIFFRLGDFYELFFDDALVAAPLLEIALTTRGKGPDGEPIPMAGVPHHAVAGYIQKLTELGHKVALCEQMADPSTVRGVVPREVVRVITPGLCLDEELLDARAERYLVAIVQSDERTLGFAALELSTGQLLATSLGDEGALFAELVRFAPREIRVAAQESETISETLTERIKRAMPGSAVEAVAFDDARYQAAEGALRESSQELLPELQAIAQPARDAAAEALAYAKSTQPSSALHLHRVEFYDPRATLVLDETAVRSLELVETLSGERRGSVLAHLDQTKTPMGARLLRRRLLSPLADIHAIRRRHDEVSYLFERPPLRMELRQLLSRLGDLERLSTRAAMGLATPRDLGVIRSSLDAIAEIDARLDAEAAGVIDDPIAELRPKDTLPELRALLGRALVESPPNIERQGGIFQRGYSSELDELRAIESDSKEIILALEAREREATKIPSLKIKYTKVFGYYIEVTRAHLGSVPEHYQRKQTVANGERYTTEELSELQEKILHAGDRACALEYEFFLALREEVASELLRLRSLSQRIAALDVAANLAEIAAHFNYCRPEIDDSLSLEIVEGRHPIVERLAAGGHFVPNDVAIDVEGERLLLITGPNMSGKSTVMRQVALIAILAQIGAFVPADSARIGLIDKVFSRVGARDDLSTGQSTFMVEMKEAAAMLRGATRRSLVILDEIGRGTSTYDGLAIAWSVAEYLHDAISCRAMFATHYHELCELAETRNGVAAMNVAADEFGEEIIFLHKLTRGGASRSYGIAVARLAGVPAPVLARAREVLEELEGGGSLPSGSPSRMRAIDKEGRAQLDLFASAPPEPEVIIKREESPALDALRALDVDRLTPLEALNRLAELKRLADDQ